MFEKCRAFVLRVHKIDDEKRIVEMYTSTRGFISFKTKIQQGKRARLKAPFFLPMNMLEVHYDYRERFSVQNLGEISLLSSMQSSAFNPFKSSMVLFLSEILVYILRKEPQNGPLFAFLEHSFRWLDAAEQDYMNFHLLFLTQLTHFLGVPPALDSFHAGFFFDMNESVFVSLPPVHGNAMEPEMAALMATLCRASYDDLHLLSLTAADRGNFLHQMVRYYQMHIPGFPELKSLAVLEELFHS